jgi:hypothetical protein
MLGLYEVGMENSKQKKNVIKKCFFINKMNFINNIKKQNEIVSPEHLDYIIFKRKKLKFKLSEQFQMNCSVCFCFSHIQSQ